MGTLKRNPKPNIDELPETYRGQFESAKFIIGMLKFGGITNFAEQAGVSYHVCASLLYGSKTNHHSVKHFAALLETIVSTYREIRQDLRPEERRLLKGWLKAWTQRVADKQLKASRNYKARGDRSIKDVKLRAKVYDYRMRSQLESLLKNWIAVFDEPIPVEVEVDFDPDKKDPT